MRRRPRALELALALALSAFACTKKTPVAEPQAALVSVKLPITARIKGLDPIHADDVFSSEQVALAYESLLQYHYLKRPYEIAPGLAEAVPSPASDGVTYLFQLKKGVLFQDDPSFRATNGRGRELVAEDVVYSLKRLADPKQGSPGWWLLDGKILGLNEWREAAELAGGADYSKAVPGLIAVDRYTVKIRLTKRSAQFLYAMAMPLTAIVPREAVEYHGAGFANRPVGTGPFRLKEYQPATRIVWARNPSYRRETYPTEGESADQAAGMLEDAGKTLPLVDELEFGLYEQSAQMWQDFLGAKLDLAPLPKDHYEQAITHSKELVGELAARGVSLVKSPKMDVVYMSFNMADPFLGKNKWLRQAISLAYDQSGAIDLFYNGRAVAAEGPIPPGLAGYDPALKNPYRKLNVARARELMSKAGAAEGEGIPALEYASDTATSDKIFGEFIERALGSLGLKVKAAMFSWSELRDHVKNRRGMLWLGAWVLDYPDAQNVLQLFYSRHVSPGPNETNYSNPEFDRLYEQALELPDGDKRTALYKRMAALVVEDCPWVPTVHRIQYTLVQKRLRNYKAHDFDRGYAKYLRATDAKIK